MPFRAPYLASMSEARSLLLAILPPVLRLALGALREADLEKDPPGEAPENDPDRDRDGVRDPVK